MTTCDRYQAWMVEALYGELDDARRAEFEAHLAGCADCAAAMHELRTTAGLMSRRRRPDPGAEYWNGYWQKLQQRVAREDSTFVDASRFARRRSLGSWGYRVAAVVALLAAGAWIGRTVLAPTPNPAPVVATTTPDSTPRALAAHQPSQDTTAAPAPEVAQPRREPAPIDAPAGEPAPARDVPVENESPAVLASQSEAHRYIERSQLLLLAVMNGDPADSTAFDIHKQRAGELVSVASSVREGSDDRRVQELVAQLELILREIAHIEQSSDADAVELVRSRVDREGVLLRINVQQMRSEKKTRSDGAID